MDQDRIEHACMHDGFGVYQIWFTLLVYVQIWFEYMGAGVVGHSFRILSTLKHNVATIITFKPLTTTLNTNDAVS
jgi:hypothetical protein